MEEGIEQLAFLDFPDIQWDELEPPPQQQEPENTTPQAPSTTPEPGSSGLGALNGVLLCFFVLVVLSFLAAQIVVYYKYYVKKKEASRPRLSRRFRPTKTITFQNQRPVVRAHVFDPTHHIPPSRPMVYAARQHGRPRSMSGNTSDATHNTLGSQSRSSFSSTVLMVDPKSNYTSRMTLSADAATIELQSESGEGSWSEGTMGRYSLSSTFFPCENPAFETDSTTSMTSSITSSPSSCGVGGHSRRSFLSSSSTTSNGSGLHRPYVRSRQRRNPAHVKRLHSGGRTPGIPSTSTSSSTSSLSYSGEEFRRPLRYQVPPRQRATPRLSDSSLTSVSSMSTAALSSFRLKKGGRRSVKWARHT